MPKEIHDLAKKLQAKGKSEDSSWAIANAALKEVGTTNDADHEWPPAKYDHLDLVMPPTPVAYVPDTGMPNDQLKRVDGQPFKTGKPYTYPSISESIHGACGQCKYFVEGGSCTIVKGRIDPIKGTCKFWEGGEPLSWDTPTFPVYEQVEANYYEDSYEPYLAEFISETDDAGTGGAPVQCSCTEEKFEEAKHPRHDKGSFVNSDGSQGYPKEKGLEFDELNIFESVAIPSSLSNVDVGAKPPVDNQQNRNYVATGAKVNSEPPMTNEEGALGFSSLDVQGFENAKDEFFEPPMQEIEPQLARYVYQRPHEADDICYQFSQRVWDLNNVGNRPVPPSEGLGYTNTHPNCYCYWLPLQTTKKDVSVTTKGEDTHFEEINRKIGQRARRHTLHTVHSDGHLSNRTRGSNPLQEIKVIRETVQLASQFKWMDNEYRAKLNKIMPTIGGALYLIRASGETITDHRNDPAAMEPYRRKLDGMELHALTRTGIGKATDINHLGRKYMTEGLVMDAEFDLELLESQMLVYESDPEIIAAIARGDIAEVSINAGTPRKMEIECDGECFVVPKGLVLGEMDGIAFTWVVSNPAGMYWRGEHIPKAKAGVRNTKIELLT